MNMKIIFTIAFTCVNILGFISPIMAQSSPLPRPKTPAVAIRFEPPQPPPGPPPTGRVRGGAKRDRCPQVEPPLTALAPFSEQSGSVVNVPYAKSDAYPTDFVLLNEKNKPVYSTAIALPEKAGIIGVTLPGSVPSLEVGKRYRWFFNVDCSKGGQSPPIYVQGEIQRVNLSPTVAQQLERAQPRQRVAIYAQNGYWYETATTLAQLVLQNPQDSSLQKEWRDLLGSINLGDVGDKPIVGK
jgi:Domain of Unknown Function (DUF928)